MVHTQYRSM